MASIHIHAPLCIVAGAMFPPVCGTLVALRFMGRKTQKQAIGMDDWLTLPPLILITGMCIATLYGVAQHAIGYHSPPLPPGKTTVTVQSDFQTNLRSVLWGIEVMQVPALGCLKASLLLFYRRIFHVGTLRSLRFAMNMALAATIVWTVAFFFTYLLICHRRFDAYWTTLANEKEYCLDTVTIHNAYGVSDVILDLIVIILPIPLLWPLQMSWKRKMAVFGLFALGALSIVASMIRMVTYLESIKVEFLSGTDTGILITGGLYWGLVECGIALICCCLPTVQSAYKQNIRSSILRVSGFGSHASNERSRGRSQSNVALKKNLRNNSEQLELEDLAQVENVMFGPTSKDHDSQVRLELTTGSSGH